MHALGFYLIFAKETTKTNQFSMTFKDFDERFEQLGVALFGANYVKKDDGTSFVGYCKDICGVNEQIMLYVKCEIDRLNYDYNTAVITISTMDEDISENIIRTTILAKTLPVFENIVWTDKTVHNCAYGTTFNVTLDD